jgi:uncharacterized membrane protein (UPF0127 family)
VRVTNLERNTSLGEQVQVAATWWKRLRGLLGRPPLQDGEGLLIRPCRAVHMLGMRYPIDVAFLDREGRIVATYPGLLPGRRSGYHRRATAALELPAGTLTATGTVVGHRLELVPSSAGR